MYFLLNKCFLVPRHSVSQFVFVPFPQTVSSSRVLFGVRSMCLTRIITFLFFFLWKCIYIIYILLFKIFWHSDFHFMVASGSCACWSVFMGPGEFRHRIWRQRPNASCCSFRGSSLQSHWEKARRCVCLCLTFSSIFVEIDVEIYQKSDGYRGVSSRIFDLIERRIIIIISYQSHTLAAFFCKLLISPCTVCKYV